MMRQAALCVLLALAIPPAAACPRCNIHNYLASTVRDAANIVVGKVLEATDSAEAEIEVIRVLRGNHRPGQRVRMRVNLAAERVGQVLVLLDPPRRLGPRFYSLMPDGEDEVRWLMDRPAVTSLDVAVQLVQGYSRDSRAAGLAYLEQGNGPPTQAILQALAECTDPYRQACLVDALMVRPDEAACAYAFRRTQEILQQPGAGPDWSELPFTPGPRGQLLTALVGACGESWSPMFNASGRARGAVQAGLRDRLRELLLRAYADLPADLQADVTFALVWTGTATADGFPLPDDGRCDGFALGLYMVGNAATREWAHEKARAAWERALTAAQQPQLVAALQASLAVADRR